MKNIWKKLGGALVLLLCVFSSASAVPTISLLTCGPTDEYVFYLYGHTAIRVVDGPEDVVYNYGNFSLEQKNFVINFMIGKPMYSVGVTTFQDFLVEYGVQGRRVSEQVLNLTPEEAIAMKAKLEWNSLPENRDYQYNFYFDNCATRPRDFIEEFTKGINYKVDPAMMPTFREAIRNKSNSAQWYTMGADLCLGWKSDKKMSLKDAAFLPDLLEQELDLAIRKDNGQKLVSSKTEYLPQKRIVEEKPGTIRWPFWTPILVAILYAILYLLGPKTDKEKWLRILRTIIYTLLGIGGVVLYFLAFSAHPHTFPNTNMLIMHPLQFMLALWIWQKNKQGKPLFWFYFINFVAVILYLALGYVQVMPEGMAFWAILMLIDFNLGASRNWTFSKEHPTVQKKK